MNCSLLASLANAVDIANSPQPEEYRNSSSMVAGVNCSLPLSPSRPSQASRLALNPKQHPVEGFPNGQTGRDAKLTSQFHHVYIKNTCSYVSTPPTHHPGVDTDIFTSYSFLLPALKFIPIIQRRTF